MPVESLKKYLSPLVVLALFVSLVVGFRSFLIANIVEPIALLCWAAWRIVSSVDQHIYWVMLIVLCSILVVRLVPSSKMDSPGLAYNYRYQLPDRVAHWQTRMKDAILGKDETEQLRDGLSNLLMSVIGQVERSDQKDLEELVAAGRIPLSPAARQFLCPPQGKHGTVSLNHQLLPRWLRRWKGRFFHQDHTAIDEILKWMETEMEISHDQ